MAGQTLWDQLIAGASDAVTDIREKLVEEPWFGRALDVPVSEMSPGVADLQPTREKEQGITPEQDLSIER